MRLAGGAAANRRHQVADVRPWAIAPGMSIFWAPASLISFSSSSRFFTRALETGELRWRLPEPRAARREDGDGLMSHAEFLKTLVNEFD